MKECLGNVKVMGINYYYEVKPPCECCKRPYEDLHIGKSTGGWKFVLQAHKELGLITAEDWLLHMKVNKGKIKDECGVEVSIDDLARVISDRGPGPLRSQSDYSPSIHETETYTSQEAEFS